jgi:hypothetical protein
MTRRAIAAGVVCLLLCLVAAVPAWGQVPAVDQPASEPRGRPIAEGPLRDAEFGVRTRELGLQRRVEMYQWRKADGGYVRVWSDAPIPSAAHDPQHANPGEFPIRTRYWIAPRVTLDGRPLQDDVLKEFGRWQVFRPGFSALPGNLAATFQPEGDGLSSAENPLDPQIGDLRITWHELTLPSLAGRVSLENGAWVPVPGSARPDLAGAADVAARPDTLPASAAGRGWWLIALGAVVALIAVVLLRRRRRR